MNNQSESNNDPLWNKLSAQWHSKDSEQLLAQKVPDNSELITNVKKEMRLAMKGLVFVITVGLLLSFYIINEIVKGLPSGLDIILYSGMLIIILVVITVFLWLARSSVTTQSNNTKSFIELSLLHVNIELNICRTGQLFGAAILVLFFGIVAWVLFHWFLSPHSMAKPIWALAIVTFVGLFFPSIIYFIHKQKVKLLVQKQSLTNLLNSLT